MTKRDYNLLADAMAYAIHTAPCDEYRRNQHGGILHALDCLMDALEKDNPAFDAQEFMQACVESTAGEV